MPDHKAESILIALTSHGQLGDTGRATGAYLPEIAHPWSVFKAAGYSVDLASVEGGDPPLDGVDLDDPIQRQFTEDSQMSQKLATTMTPKDVHPNDYAAIFFAGGHGSMWDFPDNAEFARIAIDIYERGGVIGAVCHGPAALVNMTLPNGRPLVAGKKISAFTNEEERLMGLTEVVPFLLQSRLEQAGAEHIGTAAFKEWVVVDERIVTGQNPASATGVAESVVAELAQH